MLDVMKHVTVKGVEYPLAFNLNVASVVQKKYGTLDVWAEKLKPKDKKKQPELDDIIFTYKEFINEGIDIENDEKGEKRPFLTEKQVGRLLSSLENFTGIATELITESNDNGKEKN